MIVISIIDAEDFGDELYPVVHENLTGIINQGQVGLVLALGDSKGMIYRLLCKLAIEYPDIFFSIVLSNDKLAYEGSEPGDPHIFSLDCDIAYGDPKNAKQIQCKNIIEGSDYVFCRRNRCNDVRRINQRCVIMVFN